MMTSTSSADSISDQERLSAWLDGELTGDAARFFSKRVAHDQDLLDTAQRWSLAAELLRESAGDSRSAAPHGFLDRVRVAIDQERALSADSDSVHAERFTGQQLKRSSARAASVAAALPSRRWRVPASLAASVSVVAIATLLMRFGFGGNDSPVTTLALQQATLPQVKAQNADVRRNNAQRNRRPVASNGSNATRVAGLRVDRSLQIPAPRRETRAVLNTVAAATPVAAETASAAPRRTISVPLSRALKANTVASSNDPFGLGNNTDDRILSGKPWPSASGAAAGVMNASFSTTPSQSASPWGDPMSLSLNAGAN